MVPLILEPEPDDPRAIRVMVDVRVNGVPQRWMLDTGAASSSVPADLAPSLPPAGESRSRGASGLIIDGGLVRLDSLSLGGATLDGAAVGVAPPGHPGLVGLDLLGRHRSHFRFADERLELDAAPPASFPMPLMSPPGAPHWFVDVAWTALSARACWDSGASLTVVDSAFAREHPDLIVMTGESDDGTDAAGRDVAAHAAVMAGCVIGGSTFAPTPCVVVDLSGMNAHAPWPMDLILGMPVLGQADWMFDPPRGVWAITRQPRA